MYDLVIIHSQDTTAWIDYILGYLNKGSFNKKILIQRDAELVSQLDDAATRSTITTAKAIIVIASPVHLQFLIECPNFSYFGLVTDIRRAQIFLCGSEMVDFDGRDLEGCPIFKRFPDFFSWKKLTHDRHAELLTNAMILMEPEEKPLMSPHKIKGNGGSNGGKRRRRKEFEITPTKAKCEETTKISLLFADSIADSSDQCTMEIVFRQKNVVNSVPTGIEAKWCNPYTYQFLAPDFPAGVTNFTVKLNGTEIGTKTLTYYSGEECLTQIYIHQLGRLCRYIRDVGLPTSEMDSLLSEILDERLALSIPVQAFENIFGSHCFKTQDQSQYEFPTLLHLTAKFGFQEFATKLIDLPQARQAYDIRNLQGLLPEAIAKNSGHLELARLFQDFHIVNETITSVYEKYLPEQRHSYPLSDASEYSLTPTTALSSSGSEDTYMEMGAKSPVLPPKKENSEESDNDEGGYMDMGEQELSEAIEKQKRTEELKRHVVVKQPENREKDNREKDNREKDKEQCSEEQRDVQPTTQTATEQSKPDDDVRLESLTLDDVENIADVPESQKELIEILTMVIHNKVTVADGEYLIKGWNFRHNHGRSRSFKEKQVQLSKMRDQVIKAKDKIKEPSWWASIRTVLKKTPSTTSPAHPSASASSAESASGSGTSTSKATRQPTAQESHAIGAKTRKPYKVPTTPDPRTFENVPSLLEPISENPQRNSNASASSRESLLSVASRTSTSSGVDIDTVDEEHISEMDSCIRARNPQPGNIDHGARHVPYCKRKSRNLEILEEELTCLDAPSPPPLPPRTGPRVESFRCQVGRSSPTSARPVQQQPVKPVITSIALPPMPNQARNRSSSDGNIIPIQPVIPSLGRGRPPSKSVDYPPPVSPRPVKKDTHHTSAQRRPLPTTPTALTQGLYSDPATHAVGNPQSESMVKSSSDSNIVNRSYIQCPVPASGRATVIRSRSRDNKAKKGVLLKQAVVTDSEISMIEDSEDLDDGSLSESCDKLYPLEFGDESSEVYFPAFRVLRAHTSPELSTEDLPAYRVLRAQTNPELTYMEMPAYRMLKAQMSSGEMVSDSEKCLAHFQAESIESIDVLSAQQTTEEYRQNQQREYQQEATDHFGVKSPAVDITALTEDQQIEEVLSETRTKVKMLLESGKLDIIHESSSSEPVPVYQTVQRYPAVQSTKTDVSSASKIEVLPCVEPAICQAPERTNHPPIVVPTDPEPPVNKEATTTTTAAAVSTDVYGTSSAAVTSQSSTRNRSMKATTSFDKIRNLMSGLDTAPRESQPGSTHIPSLHLQTAGPPGGVGKDAIRTKENTFATEKTSIEAPMHISKVNPLSELEISHGKGGKRMVLPSETPYESLMVSEVVTTLPSTNVIQVSSSPMSPTLISAKLQKPCQMNVLNPGITAMSKSTVTVGSKQEPGIDAEEKTGQKIGVSALLKNSEKPGSGLERIQRLCSEKISAAIEAGNLPKTTTRQETEREQVLELSSVSLQFGETTIEKQTTECRTVGGVPSARKPPSPKEGTDESPAGRTPRPLPAKPPKAKRLDALASQPSVEEQPQKLKPTSGKIQVPFRLDAINLSPPVMRSPSPVARRQEENTAAASGGDDHEASSSAKLATPPRVPSKPSKGAKK